MPHTATPWSLHAGNYIASPDGATIAYVYRAYDFPCIDGDEEKRIEAECAANAALLLAAPDLLAACVLAANALPDRHPLRVRLDAAIAKARGCQ